MADNEIHNLCTQYARNKASPTTYILDCGDVSSPYVESKYAITMLGVYNKIIESYGGSIAAYLHEKQFVSNMPDWKHKEHCPCYTPNWKHPGAKIFVEEDECFCDISGLFIDLDIKLAKQEKYITQEIVNELAFEVTKLLYGILAQMPDVVEGPAGKTGMAAHTGPIRNICPEIREEIYDTIVCYSSHRANNGRGRPLEKFKEEYFKEGVHLMFPGLCLQRDTKKRVITYLRGVTLKAQTRKHQVNTFLKVLFFKFLKWTTTAIIRTMGRITHNGVIDLFTNFWTNIPNRTCMCSHTCFPSWAFNNIWHLSQNSIEEFCNLKCKFVHDFLGDIFFLFCQFDIKIDKQP
jgi:hypothetical protein